MTAAPTQIAPTLSFEKEVVPEHDPALYRCTQLIEALPDTGAVTEQHVADYRRQGFLAVENVLSPRQVQEAKEALSDLIAGHGSAPYHLMFEAGAEGLVEQMTPEQREITVRKVFRFVEADPRLGAIAQGASLVDLVQRLIGRTPELSQNMALLKPPRGREKPWHQDHAYFDMPLACRVVGVWIALDEANVENGCMHLLPDLGGQPQLHFRRRDWQMCDTDILGRTCLAAPLKPGGALFFDSLLPHGTPTNHSTQRRRALQFHYCPTDAPQISKEERLAIFGSEGKDVTC